MFSAARPQKGANIQTYIPRVPEAKNKPISLVRIGQMTVAGYLHKECHRVNSGEMTVVLCVGNNKSPELIPTLE